MKVIKCSALSLGVLLCLTVCESARSQNPAEDFVSYRPSWKVGQTWQVDVETLTVAPIRGEDEMKAFVPKKIVYGHTFKVEALEDIEGESCYVVRVDVVSIDGKTREFSPRDYRCFRRFSFRMDDCTLKRLQGFRVLGDEQTVDYTINYHRGPAQVTEFTGFLPADWPTFSQDAQRYAPSESTEPNGVSRGKLYQARQKHEFSKEVWTVNETERPALNIVLSQVRPGYRTSPETTEQVWVRGMPWPLRSVYKGKDRPALVATLVRVDNSPITSAMRARDSQR